MTLPPLRVSASLAACATLRVSPCPFARAFQLAARGLVLAFLLTLTPARAQAPAAPGVITGRIFNPVQGEYLRNAEVRTAGGALAVSESGGVYRLSGVAPGEVTLVVTYTGFKNATAVVRVAPGETVTRDFELTSSLAGRSSDGAVKLNAFVVSSQREGNAKAIMEQRNSMNITNSVSSDVFGDVAESNIGEFLKHLPGVDFDGTDGTVRYVRLRGLASENTAVTLDGMSVASADANVGGAGNARAFSFEQVSLSSMESIEVSKTISADVEANAPAGTINLKTRRAFDRPGRRVTLQANISGQSDNLSLSRTYAPGDTRMRKIMPGGLFEYSDIFLDKRLGIIFSVSESNAYIQRAPTTMAYNYTTTAADPRPVVITQVNAQLIEQTVERFSAALSIDYRATSRLVLSLGVIYNYSDIWSGQRSATFNSGARTTVVGADPLLSFTTNTPAANVSVQPLSIVKEGGGFTYSPKFEYKLGDLTIEGKATASSSDSGYDPLGRRGSVFSPGALTLPGVTYRAERSALREGDWIFTQLSGPDWNDGAAFTTPTVIPKDGRFALTEIYSGEVAATFRTTKFLPVIWKTGVKTKRELRDFKVERNASLYNYTGPGAGIGAWRDYRSPVDLDYSSQNLTISSLSGKNLFLPDNLKIGKLFNERPEYFTRTLSAADVFAVISNEKHYQEDITGMFAMATTTVGRATLRDRKSVV